MRSVRLAAAFAAALLSLGLASTATAATHADAAKAKASLTADGSINQAWVEGAKQGDKLVLTRNGKKVGSGTADRFGSLIIHDLKPGKGYQFRDGSARSITFRVLKAGQNPPQSFYKKQPPLHAGLNYVKMRDGIEIAMTVRLPQGAKSLDDGPFPTIIEDSGYQVAAPHDLLSSVLASLGGGSHASDPLAPDTSTAVGGVIGPLLGFAVVSMQMRGSGCSGGAFDLFDLPTTYDGYDAVETVAAQKWVKGNVGLAGISFSGISQLFVAGTQPPHLAAIAPMSVTDDIYTGTGYPGGMFNSGFALSWIKDRAQNAEPAPEGGQPWAKELVKEGDQHCIDNQKLRLQTMDVLKTIQDNPFRTPSLFDQRAPGAWVPKIKVPTFFIGQFQDEQTGGHFPESIAPLSKNPDTYITLQNGVHVDSLGPSTITRWVEFLDLYVAKKVPSIPPVVLGLGGQLYKFLADAGASPIQDTRFKGKNVTYEQALAQYRKEDPKVRLLMDNGAGPAGPGTLGATWDVTSTAWPLPNTKATSWFLGDKGALAAAKPSAAASASYVGDPSARAIQTLPGTSEGDAWKAQPPYQWDPVAAGKGLGWVSPVLDKDVVIAGPSSLDLYVKSSAADTDLQVTLSEVRPDGNETYVQNGWLRASHRKLGKGSTALDPKPTHLKKDAANLPKGKYTLVRVPIFPVAHAFRAGSRIRVTLTAPGGDRPRWRFDTIEKGSTTNTIGLGGAVPSKLVLPVLSGQTAKGTPLPGATALRGEPNRTYAPASNGG